MRSGNRRNQRGIAMAAAIVLALVVSATAAVVLSLTFRRFELSAFRTDHAVADTSSEAGLQYVFARLDEDTTSTNPNPSFAGVVGFKNLVNKKRDLQGLGTVPDNTAAAEYVVTSWQDTAPAAACYDPTGTQTNGADEKGVQALILGGKVNTTSGSPTFGQYISPKCVTVRVRYFHNDPPNGYTDTVPVAGRPYKVHSSSTYGTGGP